MFKLIKDIKINHERVVNNMYILDEIVMKYQVIVNDHSLGKMLKEVEGNKGVTVEKNSDRLIMLRNTSSMHYDWRDVIGQEEVYEDVTLVVLVRDLSEQ